MWQRYLDPENLEHINALTFANELSLIGVKVPEIVQKQADEELKALKDEGMLIIKKALPLLEDEKFAIDEQLKILIKEAAKGGDLETMMTALRQLASMKIIETHFNFSVFSQFARMGYHGKMVKDDSSVVEVEAQKWEE